MKPRRLVFRGLSYYWRTNVAMVLGVATAVAVLAGALLVGDSVRGSLRDLVLQRLGRTDRVVTSNGFFRQDLAKDIYSDPDRAASFSEMIPIVETTGTVADQATGRRSLRVRVYGVDRQFWAFHQTPNPPTVMNLQWMPYADSVFVNAALASEIGAAIGKTILVRVERPSAIPIESLHGRKDNLGRSLRLTVRRILRPEEGGDFSLQPNQGTVLAAFVPLERLQVELGLARRSGDGDWVSEKRVNTLLVRDPDAASSRGVANPQTSLEALVRHRFQPEDVGLNVQTTDVVTVTSPAGVIDTSRARAVESAAAQLGLHPQSVFTYLANTMRSGDRQIPYSLVTAIDLTAVVPAVPDRSAESLAPQSDPIVLNEWAARDLGVRPGDPLSLDYFVWEDPGRIVTRAADFRVAAIVPIAGLAADRDLAPVYPGITEAATLADWDPPFPVDLRRVRKVDEDYWDKYKTTPKAFIPYEAGKRLWQSRFGDRTSIRLTPPAGMSADAARDRFVAALRAKIDPLAMGLAVRNVRADGLGASRGATDFGEYFTYFSFFLVVSALVLAALFFRLGVEQRAREVGLLRAVGFTPARIRLLLTAEGLLLAAIGAVFGVAAAVAYGQLMMVGLRTWWSGAVGTTAIRLHVTATSLASGAAGSLVAAIVCIWWTLRGLSRLSERALLAGSLAGVEGAGRPKGAGPAKGTGPAKAGHDDRVWHRVVSGFSPTFGATMFAVLGFAAAIASAARLVDRTAGFFGAGVSLLVASLCAATAILRRPPRSTLGARGGHPLWRVGLRNASERPGRSVLAIAVIASATFILIAVDAFRHDPTPPADRRSGVGGYPLLVDLLLPVVNDPNGRDGREALGLTVDDPVTIEPFRVLPGDDASCLNLYEPTRPRILGAGRRFIDEGRFAFQQSLASTDAERANPWLLLRRDFGPDVVPAIADANSMTYILHKRLGDDVVVPRGDRPLRLRLVAALDDSIFQSELIVSDAAFVRAFPEQEGYRFLLVDAPRERAARIAGAIEKGAADLGADAVDTGARLAEFHTVENTYLSTFQALGGLGLLVGTIGLAAVLLRNVLERRRELAVLGAVGYRPGDIFTIVFAEHLLLLVCGLAVGAACALVAIAPAAFERGSRQPAMTTGAVLIGTVFAAGLISSLLATRAALRTPLVAALRSE